MEIKILFITLSNIGDVILTLPVLDTLRANFPQGEITVMVGPRPQELFAGNPHIDKLIVYDKHCRLREKIKLFQELQKERFDVIVDLRNSLFGALLAARYKTSPILAIPPAIKHMQQRHLYKLKAQGAKFKTVQAEAIKKGSLYIKGEDEAYIKDLFRENGIKESDKIFVVSVGARSHTKRWARERFLDLILALKQEFNTKIILAGDQFDAPIARYILANMQNETAVDLIGKTRLTQLACLLKKAALLVTNDNGVLHLASYLDIPVVAIFGPTDEAKYGPWSKTWAVVKKEIFCRPCEKAQCRFNTLECLQLIRVEDVLRQIREVLRPGCPARHECRNDFKRILIVRTDRIGDALLSTPVIKAVREVYPHAYLAMMASSYTKEVFEGNPYLDQVIIYDKEGKHKSWYRSAKFSQNLKKKRFDLALILHPTMRVHMVTFFAGIRHRVGYDRKLGFLLTDRIKHTKQMGEKHESEYTLDLLRCLGIEPQDRNLFMPIRPASEAWVGELFLQEGIGPEDKILAIQPAASCPSRIWPAERFAAVADRLEQKYGFKVLVVCGPSETRLANETVKFMRLPAVNLGGRTSLSQLASILKRCTLFISNDSGPVHISCAVGTPVISIFSRRQKGLSPTRWKPVGENDLFLHKDVGCTVCLAHNCQKGFACLKAITVEDVLQAADTILRDVK